MIRWRIAALLRQRGWTAYRLAQEADLSFRAAYRLAQDSAVRRIDAVTLETLCDLFDAVPGDLIERVGPRKRSRKR
jgi:DNA-binding Xre family transcriptional regulator